MLLHLYEKFYFNAEKQINCNDFFQCNLKLILYLLIINLLIIIWT